jgi:hypothetical protein
LNTADKAIELRRYLLHLLTTGYGTKLSPEYDCTGFGSFAASNSNDDVLEKLLALADEAIEQVLFASLHMSLLGIVAGHPVFRWLNLRPISTASCIP